MRVYRICLYSLLSLALTPAGALAAPSDDEDAPPGITPWPVAPEFANPWPPEWEAAFWGRAGHALSFWKDQRPRGGTHGENEKNYYPTAMLAVLTGDAKVGLRALQEDDVQSDDHAYTNGVDFYWNFTLKGQMRKYFYFADRLDPDYRARMREGARKWLAVDPREPASHPVYGHARGHGVWDPAARGTRIDTRNTDNLRAMRDVAVYLMAEETGNEPLRQKYAQSLADYAHTLFNVGQSEWDSPNYHLHSVTAYLNLYDFAKDPAVKLRAKATLDWLFAAAALKYRRGGFGGPNARDYGGNAPFLAHAPVPLWLYFGDSPQPPPRSDRDDVYPLTSGYRPPPAVVALARKQLGAEPVELLATHPPYQNWSPGQEAAPHYWETQFLGKTFQLGTAVAEDTGGPWNVCAFKLLVDHSKRGVDYVVANTDAITGHSTKNPGDQIGQYRNLALWLRPAKPAKTFFFQLPRDAAVELDGGIWFYRLENTWLALRPINLGEFAEPKIEEIVKDPKRRGDFQTEYASAMFLKATAEGDTYAGFALEVGEPASHGTYALFKTAVLSEGELDLSKLDVGTATLKGSDGRTLQVSHNRRSERPAVSCDGHPRHWDRERDPYRPAPGPRAARCAPIRQPWMAGTLRVEAGGLTFEGRLDPQTGAYTFTNGGEPQRPK